MATIDAGSVKRLREMTSAGIMDCKSALQEANGDFDAAVKILREKGVASAAKKAERTASEGQIGIFVAEVGDTAAIIEVNCETDFVARNENFRNLVADLARQAALNGSPDLSELLASKLLDDDNKTVEEMVKEAISTIGENIVVSRIAVVGADGGTIGSYVHSDGKKGALVTISGDTSETALAAARDIAMQAVALRAPYLNRDTVPAEVIEAEKEIYRKQAAEEGKPEAMLEKIAEGRINKFYKENTLLEQAFIKDDKKSVGQIAKAAGGDVAHFVRFEVGQTS